MLSHSCSKRKLSVQPLCLQIPLQRVGGTCFRWPCLRVFIAVRTHLVSRFPVPVEHNQLSQSCLLFALLSPKLFSDTAATPGFSLPLSAWTRQPVFCPERSLAAVVNWTTAGPPGASFWEGPSLLTISLCIRFPPPLLRPGPGSQDVSSGGLCVRAVPLLLGIKWSPACGKLSFRGPFKSDFMQSPFPHGTEERQSAVVTQPFMLAARLPREIIPSEMSFNTSCQQTAWSPCPSVFQIMTITMWELRCALSTGAGF